MDAEDVNVLDFKSSVLHFLIICDQKEVAQSVDPWEDPTAHRFIDQVLDTSRVGVSLRSLLGIRLLHFHPHATVRIEGNV